MSYAVFVLSTGRCGTQWLAERLAHAFGDRAEVTHEPLDGDYAARAMLGAGDPARLDPDVAAPIVEHLERVERVLESRPYVECGHPLWSTLPYLLARFAGRVRIVHLVRHPVPTALSWVTENAYTPPLAPHLSEKILVSPFDAGARFPGYRERWSTLAPYEKALYYWLEVNALGTAIDRETPAPWLRVRLEDLVTGAALPALCGFVGAPVVEVGARIDEHRSLTTSWSEPAAIAGHPEVTALAEQLGYDPLAFDRDALRRRYRGR